MTNSGPVTHDDHATNPPADFMPVSAAASLLHRDVRTIHRMIVRGELHAVKAHSGLRAPYLVDRAAVTALAAEVSQ